MKTLLVTGCAGFIGANFLEYWYETYGDEWRVVNVDALTYAGNLANLGEVSSRPNYEFVKQHIENADAIGDEPGMAAVFSSYKPNWVINFAAESHVDRSIENSTPFIDTNIKGTQVLLELSRQHNVERYVQVSTDEVYGSLGATGKFKEDMPMDPRSPYSASKASADLLVLSYVHTFGFPAVITRCSNNYGRYQYPEKLIPVIISKALRNEALPVYGKGENIRDWIHVVDHCRGIDAALQNGVVGEAYNFGGDAEITNLDMVKRILAHLGKPESLISFVTDRLGHDFRYAMDFSKAEKELGWTPKISFDDGLADTIDWYVANPGWQLY
ncbi:MAG: dTDP-glucose 4,6-dehydratase [bacterium]|nr:dTDP-glucose 4,6-dehydratase [bacterium]